MHLLVLSAFRLKLSLASCNCLVVSMHLLVLSAFRRVVAQVHDELLFCLNAPFGAQCFPTDKGGCEFAKVHLSQCTFWCSVLSDCIMMRDCTGYIEGLNAPFGAQCFPTLGLGLAAILGIVSQCTFWCSVLSD